MELQRDRIYEIILGDYNSRDAVKISDLQVQFDINKSSDNKRRSNSATIEIYNLDQDTLKRLETEYLGAIFKVGYADIGLTTLLIGAVVETKTVDEGVDRVTQIILGEGYTELNDQLLKSFVPEGKTVKDVVEEIRQQMPGVVRGAFTGTNLNSEILFGYPLTGTPKQALDELSETYRLEWRVDRGSLFVTDEAGLADPDKNKAYVLNENTGLVGEPFYTSGSGSKLKKDEKRRQGVQFKALLNAKIIPGSIVRLESDLITGWYKVTTARYTGGYDDNDWYVECFCDEILREDYDNARPVA